MSPAPTTLNQLLDEAAKQFPERMALVTDSSSMTYVEFREQVLRAAAAFRNHGVQPGDRVALCLRNSLEFVAAYFGLARLGAIAVPINFMIRKASELHYMLQDCEASGIVAQSEFLPGILGVRKSLPTLRWVWCVDCANARVDVGSFPLNIANADPRSAEVSAPALSGKETACILYTSGTTGNPKGAMLSHSNLTSDCEASIRALSLRGDDVMLCLLPMFHSFAWTANVLVAIRLGIKTVIIPSITPPKLWLGLMAKHGATLFAAVPPVFSVLTREARGVQGLALRYWFFRRVRLCISGAAPLRLETMSDFERAFGLSILEGYGLTETSPVATINPPDKPKPGSVGMPIEGVQIRIIDDNENPLPAGQEGEICIKGSNVMLGYFRKPQETAETFTSDGWFKTGDVGVIDSDGYLFLRERKKDMIIIKGLKVFPSQLEQILDEHPLIEEVAVVGIPDARGEEIVKAFVVLKPGIKADKDTKATLMQFCREKFDAYKRPRDIEFLDSLPKNSLQKVLKRVLRQQELEKKR